MTRSFPSYVLASLLACPLPGPRAAPLAFHEVRAAAEGTRISVDAQVEAVREATLAAQVPGAVVWLAVKVGERVQAGQELLRIDARAAQQTAAASASQVEAARAHLQMAASHLERQQQLHQKQYISQAALDDAQAQWRAAQAQVQALQAQAGSTATQSGLHSIKAPYAGVVSAVPVALGDMALPGKPLVALYDPAALRVTAAVAQQHATQLAQAAGAQLELEVPGWTPQRLSLPMAQAQVLPTVDAQTHTVQMRVPLPANHPPATPGMFARLWLPLGTPAGIDAARMLVPATALVRRAEVTGVYVLDTEGRPLLRQVRAGRVQGSMVEVLSGVRAGDHIATEPQMAAKVR